MAALRPWAFLLRGHQDAGHRPLVALEALQLIARVRGVRRDRLALRRVDQAWSRGPIDGRSTTSHLHLTLIYTLRLYYFYIRIKMYVYIKNFKALLFLSQRSECALLILCMSSFSSKVECTQTHSHIYIIHMVSMSYL